MNKISNYLKPKILALDYKISVLIPNPKIKKIMYISIGSFFGFMFLIILLGIVLSPFRKNDTSSGLILNKPNIVTNTPIPQIELSGIQKEILNREVQIKELKFPESILNIPQIERDLSI